MYYNYNDYLPYELCFIGICLIWSIYRYFTRNHDYWTKRGINGPAPVVGFGNTLHRVAIEATLLEKDWITKYGKIYGIYEGNRPILTVADPELIKLILVKDFDVFNELKESNPLFRSKAHPVLSRTLSALGGREWRRVHSVISPTFTISRMKNIFKQMSDCVTDMCHVLDNQCSTGSGHIDIEIVNLFDRLAMDVVTTCAFNTKIDSWSLDQDNLFVQNANTVFHPNWFRMLWSLVLPKSVLQMINIKHAIPETAHEFFFQMTRRILSQRTHSQHKYNDFIDLILQRRQESNKLNNQDNQDNYITDNEILANCWIFYNSGCKVMSSVIAWTAYELARHPDIQQELCEEIRKASADTGGDGLIDYEVLSKLPFLEAVVSETLRVHTFSIRFRRIAGRDYKLGDTGITLYRGQTIEIPVYALHQLEEYFPDHQVYDPYRFMTINNNPPQVKPYTFIPFGIGSRPCIARRYALMQLKMVVARLVVRYQFNITPLTEQPVRLVHSIAHHSPQSIVLGLDKRY